MSAVTWGPPVVPADPISRALSLDARRKWPAPQSPRRAAAPPVAWSLRTELAGLLTSRPAGRHVRRQGAL